MTERESDNEREVDAEGRPHRRLAPLGWALQERILWPIGDRLRAAGDHLRWPFERLAWGLRRGVGWRAQDGWDRLTGAAAMGPDGMPARRQGLRRGATVGALGALAIGAAAAGALVAQPGESPVEAEPAVAASSPMSAPPPVSARTEPPVQGPRLRGVQPDFTDAEASDKEAVAAAIRKLRAADQARAAGETGDENTAGSTGGSDDIAGDGGSTGDGDGSTGGTGPSDVSSGDGASGGGDAGDGSEASADGDSGVSADGDAVESPLRVARKFATAFMDYEVGRGDESTEQMFRSTATEQLTESLADRPPRLPASGRVPRARVVNVVAGPREKRKLAVSVSLLRANGLAELRLDLELKKPGWLVSTVRG